MKKPSGGKAVAAGVGSRCFMGVTPLVKSWTVAELAYLAGIIDGEGCLSLSTGKNSERRRYATQIFVGNTNDRLIHWLHEHFGGTVGLRPAVKSTHKPLWRWLVSGHEVDTILRAVLPHLVVKRAQAELIIEFRLTVSPIGENNRVSAETEARRSHLKSRLLTLNKRGVI